jgi:hypothetical protein
MPKRKEIAMANPININHYTHIHVRTSGAELSDVLTIEEMQGEAWQAVAMTENDNIFIYVSPEQLMDLSAKCLKVAHVVLAIPSEGLAR